jgi:hypothetical protein
MVRAGKMGVGEGFMIILKVKAEKISKQFI